LNKEKVSREISENKIAVCEKTQGLRSGNFSDLNSACSTVLVPVKIFQFQDMHNENRFLGTFQGHSKRPKNKSERYSTFDVVEIIREHGIKGRLELISLAVKQKEVGKVFWQSLSQIGASRQSRKHWL
jgi:hypothetical protein